MPWDYILSLAGVAGFVLAGKKIWWAWYINIAAQFIWLAYALVTKQYGFLIGTVVYFIVFIKNAHDWTKEHRKQVALDIAAGERKFEQLQIVLNEINENNVTPQQVREALGIRVEARDD
jgi:hypothetical protein